MKLHAQQHDLLSALTRCASIADARSTMPVLACVLLTTAKDGLTLSASDLNQSVTATVAAEVTEPGSIAVNAKDLLDRVKALPGEIVITVNDKSTVTLRSGSRRFSLQAIPGDDFPALPSTDKLPIASLPAADLLRLINSTHFAISTDESRLHLNSALLECNGMLRMVSTDGHRLALIETATPAGAGEFTALIPLKAITELKRLCDVDGDVTLTLDGFNLFVWVGGFSYVVKTAGDQVSFPPFRQVIPASSNNTAAINRESLLNAVRAVAVSASDRTSGIKLSFTAGKLTITSESPESGEGADELGIAYEGAKTEIGCNARYLQDALGALECESVTLGVSGELDPMVIEPAGDDAWRSTAVVMPMRVGS
jgi:DNA polymerase-3 subunit beta